MTVMEIDRERERPRERHTQTHTQSREGGEGNGREPGQNTCTTAKDSSVQDWTERPPDRPPDIISCIRRTSSLSSNEQTHTCKHVHICANAQLLMNTCTNRCIHINMQ